MANVSKIAIGVHTATHMDAPCHFKAGAAAIDQLPFEAGVGPARVIAIRDPERITVTELEPHGIGAGERIMFKTANSPRAWRSAKFVEDAVYITVDAAHWLAARKVRTIGIDYLSVGGFAANNGVAVHQQLLAAGVAIIEGLDLSDVPEGPCDLICLPIKLVGGEFRLIDLASHNGTRVDTVPVGEQVLRSGQTIYLGALPLRFFTTP